MHKISLILQPYHSVCVWMCRSLWGWRYHPRGGLRRPGAGHRDHTWRAQDEGRGDDRANHRQAGENCREGRRQETQTWIREWTALYLHTRTHTHTYINVNALGSTRRIQNFFGIYWIFMNTTFLDLQINPFVSSLTNEAQWMNPINPVTTYKYFLVLFFLFLLLLNRILCVKSSHGWSMKRNTFDTTTNGMTKRWHYFTPFLQTEIEFSVIDGWKICVRKILHTHRVQFTQVLKTNQLNNRYKL